MFGLLRKLNFSQEKLSLYSLMFALETTGISSPDIVPAKKTTTYIYIHTQSIMKLINHNKRCESKLANET